MQTYIPPSDHESHIFPKVAILALLVLCTASIIQTKHAKRELAETTAAYARKERQTYGQRAEAINRTSHEGWEAGYRQSAWDSSKGVNKYRITDDGNGEATLWVKVYSTPDKAPNGNPAPTKNHLPNCPGGCR